MTDQLFADDLYELAYLTDFDDRIDELRTLAEDEDWNYRHTTTHRRNPVLFNYIKFTYKRLAQEGKIEVSPDGQELTFNTGLVSENQEAIFALFNVNRILNKQPWYFQGWFKKSDNRLSRFPALPDLASYYDDPKSLVFDFKKDFRPNIDHIIEHNRERFPVPFNTMDSHVLQTLLSGSINGVIQRIRRNYKTAIPQFFNGRVQLLLPLCLSNPRVADLALAVEDRGGFYRASTCLTLDMAYNNARQLARPDKDWLQP